MALKVWANINCWNSNFGYYSRHEILFCWCLFYFFVWNLYISCTTGYTTSMCHVPSEHRGSTKALHNFPSPAAPNKFRPLTISSKHCSANHLLKLTDNVIRCFPLSLNLSCEYRIFQTSFLIMWAVSSQC